MKFEVGKKYCSKFSANNAECVLVGPKNQAVLQFEDGSIGIWSPSKDWEEVPPPLTFGDLKVGEKFRWAGPRDCGPVVCMRIRPIGQSGQGRYDCRWLALEGPNAGTAWATSDADLVERVS